MENGKKALPGLVELIDVKIVIAVFICMLTASIMNLLGIKWIYGDMKLEIIQRMTACISCLLVSQDNTEITCKAGKNRLIITAIGGVFGIIVSVLDSAIGNQWLMVCMVAAGVLLTLVACKLAKVPYINARIGGVTFILVACTLTANARVLYAIFRFISTFFAVVVVMLVTWLFQKAGNRHHI